MATLSAKDIADLVAATQDELGRMRFQQIAQDLQDYEMMGRWLREDKVTFNSGTGIQRTVMKDTSGAAKHTGLFAQDDVNVADVLDTLTVPWRHATTNWAYDVREMYMNKGAERIVDIVKVRRTDAMIDLAEKLEARAWSAPPSSTDKTYPYGVPYWIVKNATAGFNGGNPTGFSDTGGIDRSATANANFKNYTFTFSAWTKADLIKDMRTCHRKIGFKSPVKVNDYSNGSIGDRYRIYMGETAISYMEDIGESQNENLGRDIASMDGTIVFRKNPLVWVPYLDSDTTYPIYFINHSVFQPIVLAEDYLRESSPEKLAYSHNVYGCFVDLTYNFCCVDPRKCAVGYKA